MSRAWRPPFSTAARRRPSIWLESAQSPHCSALVVATVRYSVEEKPAVTCDNTQKPWSGNHRYLLCKQKAVGSSPTVSTTAKVLVSGHATPRRAVRPLEHESA